MKKLVIANIAWNTLFIAMAASEMLGVTAVHERLPWWFKWWWIVALAAGNVVIHVMQLRAIRKWEEDHWVKPQAQMGVGGAARHDAGR